jgi:hypothetical protein
LGAFYGSFDDLVEEQSAGVRPVQTLGVDIPQSVLDCLANGPLSHLSGPHG